MTLDVKSAIRNRIGVNMQCGSIGNSILAFFEVSVILFGAYHLGRWLFFFFSLVIDWIIKDQVDKHTQDIKNIHNRLYELEKGKKK